MASSSGKSPTIGGLSLGCLFTGTSYPSPLKSNEGRLWASSSFSYFGSNELFLTGTAYTGGRGDAASSVGGVLLISMDGMVSS